MTEEELTERLDAALAARTLGDLGDLGHRGAGLHRDLAGRRPLTCTDPAATRVWRSRDG